MDYEKCCISLLMRTVQKKVFKKLMKSFLQKVTVEVEDPFTDLADWRTLLKLLEKSLASQTQVPAFPVMLENIVAEDIVDGDQRINFGLFWLIILL